ncbi:MAG: ABC1 kinase family protein [Alphaproteobacteria bacterium]
MGKDIKYIWQLMGLARIFARHDALFVFELLGMPKIVTLFARPFRKHQSKKLRPGQRLAEALQEAGATYIKLGQQLSTRSDLLGEEVCEDLRILQDNLPAFPFEKAKAVIEEDFGCPLEQIFSHFNEEAVAAASIAQVHYATTTDGKEVAVKILRPHVIEESEKAFKLYGWAAHKVERQKPEFRRFKPVETIETFRRTMLLEMNLANEAAACDRFYREFKDDAQFSVPYVDWQRTSEKVMVMERINAIRLSDKEAVLAAGIDVDVVMKNAAYGLFKQAFVHGFFHADLHPGNLFVKPNGKLIAVDFGLVGYLDERLRRLLAHFLVAVLEKDWQKAAKLHFDLGWVDEEHSTEELARVLSGVVSPIMDRSQDEISIGQLLSRVIKATSFFQMEARPELLLLEKAMFAAEGTGRYLNPSVNLWLLSREPMEAWMHKNLGPKAQAKYAIEELIGEAKRMPRILQRLEARLDENTIAPKTYPQLQPKCNLFGFILGLIFGSSVTVALLYIWLYGF